MQGRSVEGENWLSEGFLENCDGAIYSDAIAYRKKIQNFLKFIP